MEIFKNVWSDVVICSALMTPYASLPVNEQPDVTTLHKEGGNMNQKSFSCILNSSSH